MTPELSIYDILLANFNDPAKGEKLPYTKKQYVNSKYGDNCNALLFWNLQLPHAKQYTEDEINNLKK